MIEFDPGSFKDPAGRVFRHGDAMCRTLSPEAHHVFHAVQASGLLATLVADGLVADTELVAAADMGLPAAEVGEFILRQRCVPLVTYSYEWSFEMLRDAALTTLRVQDRLLSSGYILKDASAFNILFFGTRPALVDTPSIVPHRDGDIWTGYGQFCRSFLYPLLLMSYRDFDVQSLLRGELGELPAQIARKLLRPRDVVRPGVLKDVVMQARLERSFAGASASVKDAATAFRYPTALLVANVRRLLRVIEGLPPPASAGQWSGYEGAHSYGDDERSAKATFVARTVAVPRGWSRIVDIGCNTGEYADVASRSGAHVVALDLDPRAIDKLYRRVQKTEGLTPVVSSLLNPTPAMGWGLEERRPLLDRISSDGFLALALVHHLRITGGVPLAAIIRQLFRIAPEGVIEWVDKGDSMVQRMLSLRADVYDDYSWECFEASIRRHGEILAVQDSHGGARRLCHVRRLAR